MDNFEKDPRRIQEIKGRPIADDIYKKTFGDSITIKRGNNIILDTEFAIDIEITLPNKQIIIGQEKFLSNEFSDRNSLTVEYMQDPASGEKGDWYKLACQFYMCAYFNDAKTEFIKYIIVNWLQLVLWNNLINDEDVTNDKYYWRSQPNKDGKARASFKYINFKDIPTSCIINKLFLEE